MRLRIPNSRPGITVLEVLISIGILAVGLTSVVALVPAGRSNAEQAIKYDRALTMLENAVDDAVTYGLLRLRTVGVASGSTTSLIVFDTAPTATTLGAISGTLARKGVYASSAADAVASAPVAALGPILQLRDDIVIQPAVADDDLPRFRDIDGVRGFEGRFTCMLALAPLSGTLAAGLPARLTAVAFHNRDLAAPIVTGSWNSSDGALIFTPAATFHTGSVFVVNGRFYRARSVSYDNANRAHVLYTGTSLFTSGSAHILVDSVGIAERFVTLEGGGLFSQ
jgi:hypothetical protein